MPYNYCNVKTKCLSSNQCFGKISVGGEMALASVREIRCVSAKSICFEGWVVSQLKQN